MENGVTQLTLGLSLKDEATFDNYYAGINEEIVLQLKRTAAGLGERVIYLSATPGQGASHLLQACCHYASQHKITSVYLPMQTLLNFTPDVLIGFETLNLICLDDLQIIAGKRDWEEAIFHLYNRIYDAGGSIILSGRGLPKSLNLVMPDLVSRFAWGIVYQLGPLTDNAKLHILIERADRRGIHLSEEVGKYILNHCSRQMNQLFQTLDTLDKASLAAQRRLTIPFIKEVLHI